LKQIMQDIANRKRADYVEERKFPLRIVKDGGA